MRRNTERSAQLRSVAGLRDGIVEVQRRGAVASLESISTAQTDPYAETAGYAFVTRRDHVARAGQLDQFLRHGGWRIGADEPGRVRALYDVLFSLRSIILRAHVSTGNVVFRPSLVVSKVEPLTTFSFFAEGSMTARWADGKVLTVEAGTLLIDRMQSSAEFSIHSPLSMYQVSAPVEQYPFLSRVSLPATFTYDAKTAQVLFSLLNGLLSSPVTAGSTPYGPLVEAVEACLDGVLVETVRPQRGAPSSAMADLYLDARALISAQAARRSLTVEQIADELGVSRKHLERVFREEGGTTVREQLDRCRATIARGLMAHATTPRGDELLDIAHRAGFSSAASMRRALGKYAALTPPQTSK